jgi:hypothetical protein
MWTYCLTHAACFPEGWEAEHASGPLAIGNGPCALVQFIADHESKSEARESIQ